MALLTLNDLLPTPPEDIARFLVAGPVGTRLLVVKPPLFNKERGCIGRPQQKPFCPPHGVGCCCNLLLQHGKGPPLASLHERCAYVMVRGNKLNPFLTLPCVNAGIYNN
jgi:hypothetical protein